MIYPPDIDTAYEAWKANCGPCALAAILDRPVNEVRALLEGFEQRRYCNPTHLKAALDKAGVRYRSIGPRLPRYGLVFVQNGGYGHLPIKAQYARTHWIAVDQETVFDVNAPTLVSFTEWDVVFPRMMQANGIGNGTYWIRSGITLDNRSSRTNKEGHL